MRRSVLALGLDPAFADYEQMPGLTPELVKSYIDVQLERLRALGYEVVSCLVDTGASAEAVAARHLAERTFDCVMFGAGLRAAPHFLLFEKLINVVHARAPGARICFNTNPADTVEAVQRWLPPRS
jgi:riboflavin biosynthesis pyrimidine reductase